MADREPVMIQSQCSTCDDNSRLNCSVVLAQVSSSCCVPLNTTVPPNVLLCQHSYLADNAVKVQGRVAEDYRLSDARFHQYTTKVRYREENSQP